MERKNKNQKKLKEIMSKDFIKGLETGLKIAEDVAKKQGYELSFPKVDEMLIEKCEKKNENKN